MAKIYMLYLIISNRVDSYTDDKNLTDISAISYEEIVLGA